MQISWAVGFISLAGDLHRLLGCLLTNNMKPPGASIVLSDTEVNASSKHRSVSTHSDPVVQVTAVEQEKPKEHWFAGAFRLFALVVWAPLITGIISGSIYTKAEHDASKVNSVQHLR